MVLAALGQVAAGARLAAIRAAAARFSDAVALYQALGGVPPAIPGA